MEGDDFVSGGSVEWGRVAAAMVGAVLAVLGYAAARWVSLWAGATERVLAGVAWFQASLIAVPFEGGVRVLTAAWGSFIGFLPALGPAAFPVAVLATVVVLSVLFWGVSRIVWGY